MDLFMVTTSSSHNHKNTCCHTNQELGSLGRIEYSQPLLIKLGMEMFQRYLHIHMMTVSDGSVR